MLDNSQKGKSLITRSVVCCLQNRNAVSFYMDSITNIVRYMHTKMLQKISNFLSSALSPMIFAKYCKKAVRRDIMGTIQSISLSRGHGNLLLNQTSATYTYL
jgi:hypothetical protein